MIRPHVLRGVGVSPGCAIGPAVVVEWSLPDVPHRVVSGTDVPGEIERLHEALEAVRGHLEEVRRRTQERAGPSEAKIFDAQLLMLEDVEFIPAVERLIRENQLSAERAFEFKALELRAQWQQADSPWLRQRTADLAGISTRVLHSLLGRSVDDLLKREGRPVVIFTQQLTPGLTVEFDREIVAGFASVEGTRTSHAAILAHSLGFPCVMGLVGGLEQVVPGTEVILDGSRGTIILNPSPRELDDAKAQERRRIAREYDLEQAVGQPAVTLDNVTIALRGNVDLPEEIEQAAEHGAEGVGLLRTEFLVAGRAELPSEDEQTDYYRLIAERFRGYPVVVRSYDLGGDKFPAPFGASSEANPFLGWRAIRVCLDEPAVFRAQIRAVLRARMAGDIQLMLPLVTQVEEVDQTRGIVAECLEELRREGVPAADDLPVGVMIETPAAALLADELARCSDFLSVGTNDLTQYILAVDRGNARLASRFTPFHPAVVRTLKRIADAGTAAGLSVSVCGEMASEPLAALLLLGFGYQVLSVAPPRLPLVRWLVRRIDFERARGVAATVVEMPSTADVMAVLTEHLADIVDSELLEAGQLPAAGAHTSFKV